MDRPPWQDAWEGILDWLTNIVTPSWGDLIPVIPLALVALVVAVLAFTAFRWRAHAERNRSRVPRRRGVSAPPPGVHLPGPSIWPFVLPVAGAFLFAALAFRPRNEQGQYTDPLNWPLLLVGLVIGLVGIVGWLRDAMREWRRTELASAEAHEDPQGLLWPSAELTAGPVANPAVSAGRVAVASEPPPGVHLPGPSPWPLFAPVAIAVIFFGFVFHPILVVAGIVMGIVAAAGWLIDAGREYRQTEADSHEPANRDPRQAWPQRVATLYGGILAVALLVVAMPGLIAMANPAPSVAPSPDQGAGGSGGPASITLIAQDVAWDKTELTVPADQPFQIAMENKDPVPHNVAIYESEERAQELFNGELLTQVGTITYDVPALAAGPYYFICIVHPNMEGTLTAQ